MPTLPLTVSVSSSEELMNLAQFLDDIGELQEEPGTVYAELLDYHSR